MTPPFALPPPEFPLPAYVRRAESGLIVPKQAVLPGLIMPPAFMGSEPPAIVTFQEHRTSSGANRIYTATGVSLGPEYKNRAVLIFVHGGTQTRTLDSVTINGTPTTILAAVYGGATTAICGAIIPTGTSATVVTTWSGQQHRYGIAVYTAMNLRKLAAYDYDEDSDRQTPFDAYVDVPAGGFVLAGTGIHAAASGTWSWQSTMVGDVVANMESTRHFVVGHRNFDKPVSNFHARLTFSGAQRNGRFLVASFR